MIVSWNWLAQYVRLDMPVEVLADRLALTGLNHESTEEIGGDLALDLEVTSNRPDCNSLLGVAREVSVLFDRPMLKPDPRPAESGAPVESRVSLQVDDPDLCPRFTARVISGVRVGPSPWWLRKRLETLGTRSINNVVDITNYVMFESGQPLHAYDLDRLNGPAILVRRARAGETLKAINGKTYDLTPEMLAITDLERPVGLAGVMGGLDTEVGDGTTNLLIEAARFNALSVRKMARGLGLTSEASFRFERPIDPEGTEWASRRCAALILDLAGGTLHPGVLDTGTPQPPREPIALRLAQIPRVLGIEIDEDTVARILRALGLEPADEPGDGVLRYRAPSWRSDLDREIDLIEEVARVHGYEHIPEDRPVPLISAPRGRRERVEAEIRSGLTGLGFDEAVTFSLVHDASSLPIGPDGADAPPLRAEHSRRKRENALRRSLVPSLLAARSHNEAHGSLAANLFEIAHVYLPRPGQPLPDEPTHLALVAGSDVFGLKGMVEALLDRLHVRGELQTRPLDLPPFAPGQSAELWLDEARLGYLGEIDRAQLDAFNLKTPCVGAELVFDLLRERADLVPGYRPWPSSPALARDLSLVVPRSLSWASLAEVVRSAAGTSLEELTYLDTFRGGNVPEEHQSLHFGLRFRHPDRTLTGEEADRIVGEIVAACVTKIGATLRA